MLNLNNTNSTNKTSSLQSSALKEDNSKIDIVPNVEEMYNIGGSADNNISNNINDNTNNNISNNINSNIEIKKDELYNFQVSYIDNCFSINEEGKFLGCIKAAEIIKYFTHIFNKDNQFLQNITDSNYPLIKRLIGEIPENSYSIILKDYTMSPFMGDLGTLIKLNDNILSFERNDLYNELKYVNRKNADKIRNSFYKFLIRMIEYTLRLISHVSELIIDNSTKTQKLKQNMIVYSTKLMYKLSQYTEMQIKLILDKNIKISKNIETSKKLRELIGKKLDKYMFLLEDKNNIEKNKNLINNVITQIGGTRDNLSDTSDMVSESDPSPVVSVSLSSIPPTSTSDHSAIYDM